jgi:Leucine-rich repeat (LRR) protein
MKKMNQTIIIVLFIMGSFALVCAQIFESQREALIDLYNSTGGDNWTNKDGWLGPVGTECKWSGVDCNRYEEYVEGLNLWFENMTGELPESIQNLHFLKRLQISNSNVIGESSVIGKLNNLTTLILSSANLTEVPSGIENIQNLNILDLSNNNLSAVPAEIGRLSHLTELNLSDNNISALPTEIGNLYQLSNLNISNNNLTNLPYELANLNNLTSLKLSSNELTNIPVEVCYLNNLEMLYLDANKLTGIPFEIENLSSLQTLSLRANDLTSLPTTIGNLSNLSNLELDDNKLTNIPAEIGNLSNNNLHLYLTANQLLSLPREITNFTSSMLFFDYNAIETTDPEIIEYLNNKMPNWIETQTVSPKQLTVTNQTGCSIQLSWSSIDYKRQHGGYEIFYSESNNKSYKLYEVTRNKYIEKMDITGLHPKTTYYLKARSVTYPHTISIGIDGINYNTVYSKFTDEITAKTQPPELEIMAGQDFIIPGSGKTLPLTITVNNIDNDHMKHIQISASQGEIIKDRTESNQIFFHLEPLEPDEASGMISILVLYQSTPLTTIQIEIDQTPPEIVILTESNSTEPVQHQEWEWGANEAQCLFRFAITQNETWTPQGIFSHATTASIKDVDGIWYLHVQAIDRAGYLSEVSTTPVLMDNTPPRILGLSDSVLPEAVNTKVWSWSANEENCLYRYAVVEENTWWPTGIFKDITSAEKTITDSIWYLHVQPRDFAGNIGNVVTVSVQFSDDIHENPDKPLVSLVDPPPEISNISSMQLAVTGQDILAYKYKFDQNEWSAAYPITATLYLSHIDDGSHSISIIGQNMDNSWQDRSAVYRWTIDTQAPQVSGLSDTIEPVTSQTWHWQANEDNCTFRYAINTSETWTAAGNFDHYTMANKGGTTGIWYLHVQAKDLAGNLSKIVTVSVPFKALHVEFINPYLEFPENESPVEIPLKLSHALDQDFSVEFKRNYDHPIPYPFATGLDYELVNSSNVIIPAGETQGAITLTIIDDDYAEIKEGIVLELLETNVTVGMEGICSIVILDNDKRGMTILKSSAKPLVLENGDPQSLTIVLNSRPEYDVDIELTTDIQHLVIDPIKLTFEPEQWNVAQNVIVSVQNDDIYKGSMEATVSLTISSDDPYNGLAERVKFSLQDDDPLPIPPVLLCPDSPNNSKDIEWCWNSGGGTNLFRFKIDDSNLDIGAEMSGSFCHQPVHELPDGLHTFYIQEKNEFTNRWSDTSFCHIEIDTGPPCTISESPLAVSAQGNHFTISYAAADRYKDSSCWNETSGSGLQKIELWVAAPGDQTYHLHNTDTGESIDNHFEYTAIHEGTYRFITNAVDKAGNEEYISIPVPTNQWESETVYTKNFSGYAILSVGAVTDQEGIDSHTLTADNIYKHLINRHFGIEHDLNDPLDHIKYFNPHRNTHSGVDHFDTDELDQAMSYKLSLQHSIEQWAYNKMCILSGPLYIILINHGARDTFYLSDSSETVSPQELNTWITKLEDNLKQKDVVIEDIVIVVGTCYSGSFISSLSGPGRVVIASSAHDEPSYRGSKEPGRVREGAFFVSNLFNELASGKNLADSFIISVNRTEDLTSKNSINRPPPYFDTATQHPLLDDDGDGKGSNNIQMTNDGRKSEGIYLGSVIQQDAPLCIIQTQSNPQRILSTDQETVSFQATVNHPDQVEAMWIEIRKPDDRLPEFIHEFRQQELDLEEVYMSYQPDLNQYILNDYPFDALGKYSIYFYVKDMEGIISGYNEMLIYKNKAENNPPDPINLLSPVNLNDPEYQDADITEFTDVILQWDPTRDPDHDQFTYTVYLSLNIAFEGAATIVKEQLIETICLVKLPDSWDDSPIYWKVAAIDDFGAQSESDVWLFHTDNPEDALPIVYVHVYDSRSNHAIPNALVQLVSAENTINMAMNYQGLSIERVQPGDYEISINGDHYHSRQESMTIQNDLSLSFDLNTTIQPGDINRNERQDVGDIIQCLQIISGIEDPSYYYDQGALTGEVLELRDAIFIMQGLSEVTE